jgi:hypothetical protein
MDNPKTACKSIIKENAGGSGRGVMSTIIAPIKTKAYSHHIWHV